MSTLIECSTCGYPLTPEEREGLVEIDGKMCKPRKPRQPLSDAEITALVFEWWCPTRVTAKDRKFVRAIERAHGIGSEE